MLERLHGLASAIRPAAPFLAAVAALLLIGCALLILTTRSAAMDRILLPMIAGLVWSVCGYVFIRAFETIPVAPHPGMRTWAKLRRRMARAWLGLLALALGGAMLAALSLSGRLIGEAFGA